LTNATGSVLLDTSVVVDYFRQDPKLHLKIDQVDDICVSLEVLGKLYHGARKSSQKEKSLTQVRNCSQSCIVLLPDETTAELSAQIKAELAAKGKSIPENDVWIAAIARQEDLPLATRDRHFSFVSGLTILDW